MKTLLLVAASTLTLGLAAPAFAQDHSEHQAETPAPAPAPAEDHSAHEGHVGAPDAPAPEGDHCVVSLEGGGQMACRDPDDHTQMDHSQMDHSQMDHGVAAEGAVDHGALGHALAEGPIEASGTSRLPQAEGMMPGVHFDLGGGWMGMAHGYAWGVYS